MSLPNIEGCLYDVDPVVSIRKTSNSSAHSRVNDPKWPLTIKKWTEFGVDTLRDSVLGRALSIPFDRLHCPRHGAHVSQHIGGASSEKDLDRKLSATVQCTVNCTLQETQETLLDRDSDLLPRMGEAIVTMEDGDSAELLKSRTGDCDYKPDWAGCLLPKPSRPDKKYQAEKPKTILPGDTKLRWKVNFEILNAAVMESPECRLDFPTFGLENRFQQNLQPYNDDDYYDQVNGLRQAIMQLYTYCYHADCRYGYILTETQLFVFRIRPCDDGKQETLLKAVETEGLMEYRTIGYNRNDRTKLSVNLALWWLHLLAAIDHKIAWKYPPLASMTMDPRNSSDRSRGQSVESEAPTNSQIEEDQPYDLRPYRRKRKQSSMHDDGLRNAPTRPKTPTKMSTDRQIQLKPPYPSSAERSDQSSQSKHSDSKHGLALRSKSRGKDAQSGPTQPKYLAVAAKPKNLVRLPQKPIRPARPPLGVLMDYVRPAEGLRDKQDQRKLDPEPLKSGNPTLVNEPMLRSKKIVKSMDIGDRRAHDTAAPRSKTPVQITRSRQLTGRRVVCVEPPRRRTQIKLAQPRSQAEQTTKSNDVEDQPARSAVLPRSGTPVSPMQLESQSEQGLKPRDINHRRTNSGKLSRSGKPGPATQPKMPYEQPSTPTSSKRDQPLQQLPTPPNSGPSPLPFSFLGQLVTDIEKKAK